MLNGWVLREIVLGLDGTIWAHFASYVYVDPVLRGRAVVLGRGEIPLEFGGDYLPGLGRQAFNLSDLAGDVIRIRRDFYPD